MMDFDATRLYPSAMWDEKCVYPKVENRFAFKPQMNDVYVGAFTSQPLNKNKNESAIFKTKSYSPPKLILQRLLLREKVKNTEVHRMRNVFIRDQL